MPLYVPRRGSHGLYAMVFSRHNARPSQFVSRHNARPPQLVSRRKNARAPGELHQSNIPNMLVVTRWDPNKSGNRERTETEWLVLGLGWG